MATSDPRLATCPAIKAEAERMARESWDAVRVGLRAVFGHHVAIEFPVPSVQHLVVEAQLALLCDLSRPESRDKMARMVAAKLGLVCGATAPTLRRSEPYWCLCAGPQIEDGEEWDGELDFGPSPSGDWERRRIPELATITDPAEALAIIARRVLGGEE